MSEVGGKVARTETVLKDFERKILVVIQIWIRIHKFFLRNCYYTLCPGGWVLFSELTYTQPWPQYILLQILGLWVYHKKCRMWMIWGGICLMRESECNRALLTMALISGTDVSFQTTLPWAIKITLTSRIPHISLRHKGPWEIWGFRE